MRGRSGGDAFFPQAAQADHLLDALTPVDLCQHIGYTPVAVGGKGEFAIADILKSTLRVGQGVTVYDSGDMTGLGGRATEEFAARGHVEKDILDINDGAHRQAGWQVADDSSAFDAHLRAGFGAAVTAAKRQAADCGDAVEGFTAKTECGDGVEVGGAVQLAGGVALEGQRQFSGGDAVPVVGNAQQPLATFPDLDLHLGRAGIEAVLDQLFGDIGRPLHHFTGGDFRAYIL